MKIGWSWTISPIHFVHHVVFNSVVGSAGDPRLTALPVALMNPTADKIQAVRQKLACRHERRAE